MAAEKPITAADSMLALRAAPASSAWPSRTRRAHSLRKITGIMRKVEPLPMPAKKNSRMKAPRKPKKLPWPPSPGRKAITANTPPIISA